MRLASPLIRSTAAMLAVLLPLGCGSGAPTWLGGQKTGAVHAHGADGREIPLTPGTPNLGQQPLIPRDPAMDGKVPFNLLYTNDIHSRVDPFPGNFYYSLYAGKGGFSRIATAIRNEKAAQPATLAVDSGDYLQGTPFFNFFKGETEMKLMQAAGYDAITIGNHEFDNGVDDLKKVLPFYRNSLITTNMTFTPDVGQRYSVKKIGNVRVGMFALITEVNGLISAPNFRGAHYYDPIKTAQAAVAKLKKECDVIVVLSHMGTVPPYSEGETDDHENEPEQITDEKLAARVPGIDVIVSGHTHVMVKNPKVIKNAGGKTFIVSVGMGGGFLGKASIVMDGGKLASFKNEAIPLTAAVPGTPEIESVIAPYRQSMDKVVKEELASSTGVFKRYGTNDTESALNNLIADATLAGARTVKPEVSFAVMSSGTPRNPLPSGRLLVEDVFYALPFDNKIVIMQVTGKQAVEMLTIQRRPTDHKRHAISNCSYVLTQNAGPIKDVTIAGKPVDLNAKYWVAVNDYMADGSSGFSMLPGCPRVDTGIKQRDALIQMIRSAKTITPDTGRIKLATRP